MVIPRSWNLDLVLPNGKHSDGILSWAGTCLMWAFAWLRFSETLSTVPACRLRVTLKTPGPTLRAFHIGKTYALEICILKGYLCMILRKLLFVA